MKLALFLLLLVPAAGFSQSLKKKYLGTYSGTIESYRMGIGEDVLSVEPATVEVTITPDSLVQSIGGISTSGTYVLRESKKEYFVLEFRPKDQLILVEYRIYRKGKKILRKGIYPQPDAELFLRR